MKSLRAQFDLRTLATMALAFALFALFPDQAHATFLQTGANKVLEIYRTAVSVIYVIGGLGIIVMAIFAFAGRFKWTHFFSIAGGIFLVAVTNELIMWLGGSGI